MAAAIAAACVGSDPVAQPGSGDSGVDAGGSGPEGGGVDGATDAGSDTSPGDDASSRPCSTGVAPTHTLSNKWAANPPNGTAAPLVFADKIALATCTMSFGYVEDTPATTKSWHVFVKKSDTTAGSCTEAKGYRELVKTFQSPQSSFFFTRSTLDDQLVVVAYDYALTASSDRVLVMEQLDWATGDTVHAAKIAVAGSAEGVPPAGTPTNLGATSCDVTLEGLGVFPGAAGANADAGWTASYPHFLAPEAQEPSPATSAQYK